MNAKSICSNKRYWGKWVVYIYRSGRPVVITYGKKLDVVLDRTFKRVTEFEKKRIILTKIPRDPRTFHCYTPFMA